MIKGYKCISFFCITVALVLNTNSKLNLTSYLKASTGGVVGAEEHTASHLLAKDYGQDTDIIANIKKQIEESKNISDSKIAALKEQVENSRNEIKAKDEIIQAATVTHSTTAKAAVDDELSPSSVFETHEICSFYPSEHLTATRFWQKYLPRILDASKNPLIPELLTAQGDAKMRTLLENTLPPSRLRKAVRHMPTVSHSIVKHVVEIIQKRMQDPDNNPPLRVVVFGGSVTIGTSCLRRGRPNLNCAWPKRLELLLNQFAKKDIVKVYNLAVGGTTSGTGTKMVKYWMYPNELSKVGPDVIINSYSTNDSMPPRNMWPNDNIVPIVMDQVMNNLQSFVREALQSKQCTSQPLVVHVDDYLGPNDAKLFRELSYGAAMTQIAEWYDTVAISYNEVVRDIYYRNFEDKTFGNNKDVHYGHWAHQTIAWSVGFASLDLLKNYCDDEYIRRTKLHTITGSDKDKTNNINIINTTVSTINNEKSTSDELMEMNMFLPPPLTRDILVKDMTKGVTIALDAAHQSSVSRNCTTNSEPEEDISPCIVSWITAPGGYDQTKVTRFINKHKINIDGWKIEKNMADGWANKIGWIAIKSNATLSLKFNEVAKDVKTVTLFFMRSYGEKWKDSIAKVTVSRLRENKNVRDNADLGDIEVLSKENISGVHADHGFKYSLTLSQTMMLTDIVKKGETMTVAVDLVSGSHFKIMGMMICNK